MPGANTSAASEALAAKRAQKKGRLCLNRRQRLERELRKAVAAEAVAERKAVAAEAVAAEAKEGALGADYIDAAAQEAFWARGRQRAGAGRGRVVYGWR